MPSIAKSGDGTRGPNIIITTSDASLTPICSGSDDIDLVQHTPSSPISLDTLSGLQSSPVKIEEDADSLQKRLMAEIIHTKGSATSFLPLNVLSRIFTPAAIIRAIQNDDPVTSYREALKTKICNFVCPGDLPDSNTNDLSTTKGSKLFSILLRVEKPATIVKFMKEGLSDVDLPFNLIRNGGNVELQRRGERGNPGESIRACRSWKIMEIESFDNYQWSVLSPLLSNRESHYALDSRIPLPFIQSEENCDSHPESSCGAFSRVFRAMIHHAHFDFDGMEACLSDDNGTWFAIKKLNSSDESAFKKEAGTLTKFSINSHKHLIQLLATYRRNGDYYLIFPLASENLRGFWERFPIPRSDPSSPGFDPSVAMWMAEQCHGLAVGLSKIHVYPSLQQDLPALQIPTLSSGQRRYGRHSDIKPENILWFQGPDSNGGFQGTLKISDFGFAQFNSRYSRSNVQTDLSCTPTYRPPECDFKKHPISRSVDLWTLGCVYLEFITWHLKGSSAVIKHFTDRRVEENPNLDTGITEDTFFKIKGSIATVKVSVTQWMDDLHHDPKCTRYLHDFLTFIRSSLIVPDPKMRANCDVVVSELEKMLRKCRQDEAYYTAVGKRLPKPPQNPEPYVCKGPTVSRQSVKRRGSTDDEETTDQKRRRL